MTTQIVSNAGQGASSTFRRAARSFYWYAMMALGVAFLTWADAAGHQDSGRLALGFGFFALVVMSEPWLTLRGDHTMRGDIQRGHDIGHFLVAILGEVLCVVLLVRPSLYLAGAWRASVGAALWPTSWPYALQALLSVFIADGMNYWSHRMVHAPLLWPIHALHHDIVRLNVLKGARVHALNVLFRGLTVYVPLMVAGMPPLLLFWYGGAIVLIQTVGHGNVDIPLPDVVHRWFVTPGVHRLHHANVARELESNFAGVFSVWDRCFGTYRHPEAVSPEVGIQGDEHQPPGFVAQLLYPFRRWSEMVRDGSTCGPRT